MKNSKMRILNYLLAAAGLLLTVFFYSRLPEQIPTHWNMDGTVTFGSKTTIFLTGGMGPVLAVLFDILPKIDPRRQNYEKFGTYYDLFCVLMQIFLLGMNGMILTETFRPGTISVPQMVLSGIGLLFLFIGNIMPKFRSNFYMGIKTPWTISSEEVWYKTHRLGGKCFFLAGLFCLLCGFLPFQNGVLFTCCTILLLFAAFFPAVMSYVWWRQEQRR